MRTEGIDFEVMDIEGRCQNRGEKKTTGQAFGVILLKTKSIEGDGIVNNTLRTQRCSVVDSYEV